MFHTSYYANPVLKRLRSFKLISVSWSMPKNYCIFRYDKLVPTYDILKLKNFPKIYTEAYHDKILSKLDPEMILNELDECIILCWEKPESFCHRHLIANWINDKLGVGITEIPRYLKIKRQYNKLR